MPDAANNGICANERILNLPEIDQRHRHTVIFQLFEHLPPDRSLQLVSDHDPRLLRAHSVVGVHRCVHQLLFYILA